MNKKVVIDIHGETTDSDGTFRVLGKIKRGQRSKQFILIYSWGMNRWSLMTLRYTKNNAKSWKICPSFPGHIFSRNDFQSRSIILWMAKNPDQIFGIEKKEEIQSEKGMIRIETISDNEDLIKETGYIVDAAGRERKYMILVKDDMELFLQKDGVLYWTPVNRVQQEGFGIFEYEDGSALNWMCENAEMLIDYEGLQTCQ